MVPTRLPDPFGGLTVALTEPRNNAAETASAGTWVVTGGPVLACPDTPTGLCVTIG
jgi:hypothetical protein